MSMADQRRAPSPASGVIFSRPANRVSGDWSAHIATTIDRLADLLEVCSDEQWEAPSMCDEWRVRDVVGHIIWRLGSSNATVARASIALRPQRKFADLARAAADQDVADLIQQLRTIAAGKLAGHGATGLIELTEAIVHAYDITEALGLRLRLSPRSTGAVALARTRVPAFLGGKNLTKTMTLRAVDARWQIGRGTPVDTTSGSIIMYLFGRIDREQLVAQANDSDTTVSTSEPSSTAEPRLRSDD